MTRHRHRISGKAGRVGYIALSGCLPLPAMAQTLGQGQDGGVSLWRVIFALLLCLALAVAGAFAVRSRTAGSGALLLKPSLHRRRLHLIETVRLPHQVTLCLLRCDGRELLLSTSPQGAHLLPAPEREAMDAEGGAPQ